jgi:multimeric flavodoxin WrbA
MIKDCIPAMTEDDGIIIGSPVYFSNITPTAAAYICRVRYVARANGMQHSKKSERP